MIRALRYCAFIAAAVLGCVLVSHAPARAAGCTVTPVSFPDLIKNYDPVTAPQTIPVAASSITISCSGENNKTIRVFVSGTSTGYTTPFLTGPGGFTLSYNLCVPGTTGCDSSTNVWNTTAAYSYTASSGNDTNNVPAFSIYVPKQDAPVGTTAQYSGSLFFSVTCNNSPC